MERYFRGGKFGIKASNGFWVTRSWCQFSGQTKQTCKHMCVQKTFNATRRIKATSHLMGVAPLFAKQGTSQSGQLTGWDKCPSSKQSWEKRPWLNCGFVVITFLLLNEIRTKGEKKRRGKWKNKWEAKKRQDLCYTLSTKYSTGFNLWECKLATSHYKPACHSNDCSVITCEAYKRRSQALFTASWARFKLFSQC